MSTSRMPPSAIDYNRPLRRRDRSKLLTLLALEIESAARWCRRAITEADNGEMADSLRFIERQISFIREVNSYADEFKLTNPELEDTRSRWSDLTKAISRPSEV